MHRGHLDSEALASYPGASAAPQAHTSKPQSGVAL